MEVWSKLEMGEMLMIENVVINDGEALLGQRVRAAERASLVDDAAPVAYCSLQMLTNRHSDPIEYLQFCNRFYFLRVLSYSVSIFHLPFILRPKLISGPVIHFLHFDLIHTCPAIPSSKPSIVFKP